MALLDAYRQQVALLVRVLPLVASEPEFALKGGTAINLFIRDLPRLSVDIDLTYLPVTDRTSSLLAINAAMLRMAGQITAGIKGAKVTPSRLQPDNKITKLVVRHERVQIKIEVTPVLRGAVYAAEMRAVTPRVEEAFGFAEIQVTSFADLYAGKIVAALDRQHPRDLFDVRDLLANEGIDGALRSAFVIYILSHPRPIAELLAPRRRNLDDEYARGFVGMTDEAVPLEALIETREAIIAAMIGDMPDAHRSFLLGLNGELRTGPQLAWRKLRSCRPYNGRCAIWSSFLRRSVLAWPVVWRWSFTPTESKRVTRGSPIRVSTGTRAVIARIWTAIYGKAHSVSLCAFPYKLRSGISRN